MGFLITLAKFVVEVVVVMPRCEHCLNERGFLVLHALLYEHVGHAEMHLGGRRLRLVALEGRLGSPSGPLLRRNLLRCVLPCLLDKAVLAGRRL